MLICTDIPRTTEQLSEHFIACHGSIVQLWLQHLHRTFSVFTSNSAGLLGVYNYNISAANVLYFNRDNVILNVQGFAKNSEFSCCIWQIALLNQSKWSKLNKTIKYFDCLQMLPNAAWLTVNNYFENCQTDRMLTSAVQSTAHCCSPETQISSDLKLKASCSDHSNVGVWVKTGPSSLNIVNTNIGN